MGVGGQGGPPGWPLFFFCPGRPPQFASGPGNRTAGTPIQTVELQNRLFRGVCLGGRCVADIGSRWLAPTTPARSCLACPRPGNAPPRPLGPPWFRPCWWAAQRCCGTRRRRPLWTFRRYPRWQSIAVDVCVCGCVGESRESPVIPVRAAGGDRRPGNGAGQWRGGWRCHCRQVGAAVATITTGSSHSWPDMNAFNAFSQSVEFAMCARVFPG